MLRDHFDGMAVVVDWLDACRNQNLDQLLEAYAGDARLECACEGISIRGRDDLAAYWKPKLAGFAPAAFGIEEIIPAADGVRLDYLNFEGKAVRIHFAFDANGKIAQTRCGPAPLGD
jgi:limonene-1,2-epoxide hydrolase